MSRQLALDLPADDDRPPQVGDWLTTARRRYVVVESREVDSRVWCNRWRLTLRDRGEHEQPEYLSRHFHSGTYRRGERPTDYFGPLPEAVE